ncbi:MAG: methylated-DNA--[protein]-cysteine S-methyltransferase [Thermoanaerobaculia bacterium]|nr:methylated-DNA--[protein]-cysteine S-methyltransferase [Thermoanaerobaculia bacterium]
MRLASATLDSPVGRLLAVVWDGRLCELTFDADATSTREHLLARFGTDLFPSHRDPAGVCTRLRAYFRGDLEALEDVEVDLAGTPFQERVWAELRRIRPGTTRSYADVAAAVGDPKALRAVGMAAARNPAVLVVPCHRVVASDGSLHGFSGGIERKRWLLVHEGALLA